MNKIEAISTKACFPKKFAFAEHIGKDILTMGGQAFQFKAIKTQFGESIALQGAFIAVNLLTGEMFESSTMFAPASLADQISKRLADGEAVVEFTARIALSPSNKNAQGYSWIAAPILPESALQRHEEMRAALLKASQPLIGNNAPTETKAKK